MRKKKILIPYTYDSNWIGGTYYIENLLKSLELNKSFQDKYELYIFTNKKSFNRLKEKSNLPMKTVNWSFFYKIKNKVLNMINLKLVSNKFDLVFPHNLSRMQRMSRSRICWIPDFQEKYYPEFFSKSEIDLRDSVYNTMIKNEQNVVFSSQNALDDYQRFYSQSNLNKFVLNFATFHDFENLPKKEDVLRKFNLEERFYICSNQFWIHKNHKVVLHALDEARRNNPEIQVVFTGKEHDYRAPTYSDDIAHLVKNLGLEGNTKFLGFIDRSDQLALMRDSIAVIQPSLFEGWSTVVEDAKALSKKIIASNLHVHIEQLKDRALYFNPEDSAELSKIMLNTYAKPREIIDFQYDISLKQFGEDFERMIEQIIS